MTGLTLIVALAARPASRSGGRAWRGTLDRRWETARRYARPDLGETRARGQPPRRRPPRSVRGPARAGRRQPVHGAGLSARGRDDPERGAARWPTSCAAVGCASCEESGRGSRRGCASSSRPARSPSWSSSSASWRRTWWASGAISGSAPSARSSLPDRSAFAPPRSSARRLRPGGCGALPGSGRRPRRGCSRRWPGWINRVRARACC